MKDSLWFLFRYVFCVEWTCNAWLLNELEVEIVADEKCIQFVVW